MKFLNMNYGLFKGLWNWGIYTNTHYLKDNIISLLDLVTALTAETTASNEAFLGIFALQLRESW